MIEVLKCIEKRKVFYGLIMLQFAISIIFFYISAAGIQSAFYINISVPRILDADVESIIHLEIAADADKEKFNSFVESIKKENVVESITTYDLSNIYSDMIGGEVGATEMDIGISAIKEFELAEGNYFQASDYIYDELNVTKDNPISIVVGYELAEKYDLRVGSIIRDEYRNVYYCVKGILEAGSKWFLLEISQGDILDLDNHILMPRQDNVEMHYYCTVDEKMSKDVMVTKLEQMADNQGVAIQATYLSDELETVFNNTYNANIYWMVFAIVLIILLSIGTATLFVAQVDSRKSEMGIKLAMGYSVSRIRKLLVCEVIIAIGSTYLVATIIGRLLLGGEMQSSWGSTHSYGFYLSTEIMLLGAIITIVMCIPAIMVMLIKIRNLQPRELIGGND